MAYGSNYGTYGTGTTGSTGTTGATASSAGSDVNWIEWLKFASEVNDSRKKGSFKQVPMSPQQNEMFNYAMGRVKGLPDTTANLAPLALGKAYASPSIDVAAMKRGEVGYGAPKVSPAQLAGVLRGNPTTTANSGPGVASQAHMEGGGRPQKDVVGNDGGYFQGEFERGGGLGRMGETDPNRNVGIAGGLNSANPTYNGQGVPSGMNRGQFDIGGFAQFLHSQGVQDAAKVALGFFTGGLTGATLATAKVLYDRWHSSQPPPAAKP